MLSEIHQCQCPICTQAAEHPDKLLHHRMNLLLSRLDEQQRRWYVALEAQKIGHGGISQLSKISGIHPETIRRGQRELSQELETRPNDRVRLPGGRRPATEKKDRRSKKS